MDGWPNAIFTDTSIKWLWNCVGKIIQWIATKCSRGTEVKKKYFSYTTCTLYSNIGQSVQQYVEHKLRLKLSGPEATKKVSCITAFIFGDEMMRQFQELLHSEKIVTNIEVDDRWYSARDKATG